MQDDWGVQPDLLVSMTLSNASSNTDAVQVVDCNGTSIDTVIYGPTMNGTDPWLDDLGNVPTSFAPKPSSGLSTARSPNGVDTNDSGADFASQNPSPKAENGAASSGGSCDSVTTVVINEFLADPAGSDTDREWVELFNHGADAVDISGWEIQGGASSFSAWGEIPEGTVLEPGAYFLIGDELVQDDLGLIPDLVTSMSLGNAGSNVDALRITDCSGNPMDTVIYGESYNGTDPWVDDLGNVPTSFAPKPASGQSLGRVPNGVDSNDSGADFSMLSFVSPKGANDVVSSCDGATAIKINEFLPNPDSDDATFEWIELYNTSAEQVDLSGWSLQWGTSSYSSSFSIPTDTFIEANGFIIIGGEGVEGADVVAPADDDLSMGAASSNADSLRLLHCGPGVSDTVIYGPTTDGIAENTDEWEDDNGIIATSIGPKPSSGVSIARRVDGVDSNDSGIDFMNSAYNTPGEANPEVLCQAGNNAIKINEIFPNPDGSDSGYEWIELYNTSAEEIRLDAWVIETASSSWSVRYTFPPETAIAPNSFFLVGEEYVPNEVADLISDSNLSLGNASTGLDGVRLIDCPANVEDTILYGKAGAFPSEEEVLFLDDAGLESFAIFPESGKSIGRFPDGEDSDVNDIDFQSNMTPSPNEPNIENTSGSDTGDNTVDLPSNSGCGNQPSGSEEPSKCSYMSGMPKFTWFIFLFALWRRKT